MKHTTRTLSISALLCASLALAGTVSLAGVDRPKQAIKADAHQLASHVKHGAHVMGRQIRSDAHDMHRELLSARERASQQLHYLRHRVQRWWSRVRAS